MVYIGMDWATALINNSFLALDPKTSCDPKTLPKYESSHEFQTKKKRQQQRQQEEAAKRQKLQHPPLHARLPPIQHSGQGHAHIRPNQPMHGSQPAVAPGGPSLSHYGKPRGPSAWPNRYSQGSNPSGGYGHPNRGSGYGNAPYPPQGRGPPYGSSGFPGPPPRGSSGASGYNVGGPNYQQGGPYGAGRGSNMMVGSRNQQQYGWQQ